MNKSDLAKVVSVKHGLEAKEAETVVDGFFGSLLSGLVDGRRVELRGFGSFHVKDCDGYLGRNPRTGETVTVAPKKATQFKIGKELRRLLNEGIAGAQS